MQVFSCIVTVAEEKDPDPRSSYSVKSFLHELQQHADSIHIDPHVFNGALLYFWHQQHIQAVQGEVAQQVNSMAEKEGGWS